MIKKILIILLLCVSPCWGGVEFDGVDDLATTTAGSSTIMNSDSNWTVSIWFKNDLTSVTTTQRMLVLKRSGGGSGLIIWNADGAPDNFGFIAHDGGGFTSAVVIEAMSTLGTTLHNVIITYDGTTYKSYLDGVADDTLTDGFAGFGTDPLIIGADAGNPFDGTIYDIDMWRTDLTAPEVSNYYGSRLARMELNIESSNIAGCWHFDDQPTGDSADGDTMQDNCNGYLFTGDNGANNTGLTWTAGVLSYPPY